MRLCTLLIALAVGAVPSAQSGLLTSVTPMGASSLVTINIVGTGFDPVATKNEVSFVPSTGPTLTALGTAVVTVDANTGSRRLTVKVPAGLPIGPTALRVRNLTTGGVSQGKSLEVIAITLPEASSVAAGAINKDIRITGSANTHFVAGSTQVSFGTGVTVNKVTVQSDTTLLANISVPDTTAPSVRTVQVTSAQIAILPGVFTITAVGPPANHPPTANAGGPYSGLAGAAISFSGSGSDPDTGDTLSFSWVFGDGATGTGASPAHSYATAGSYTATLTVSDGRGGSATSSATVTISAPPPPPNHNPTASAGGPYSGLTGTSISFTGSGSDPDAGDTLSYSWDFGDGASAIGASAPHAYSTVGSFTAKLTVADNHGGVATATTAVTISAPPPTNQPPNVVISPSSQIVTLPAGANLDAAVSDDGLPAGGSVTFSWTMVSGPAPVSFASANSKATGATFTQPGTYVLRLTASDSVLSGSADLTVTVNAAPVNQKPAVSAGSAVTITLPNNASLAGSATDDGLPAGGTLTTQWSKISGPGMVTFGSGSAPVTTAAFELPGTYVLRLTASDSVLSDTADVTVTVFAATVNHQPVAVAGPAKSGDAGAGVAFDGTGSSDPDGDVLTFAWSFGDQTTSTDRKPFHVYQTVGVYTVTLVVTDSHGSASAPATTTATIAAAPDRTPPLVKLTGPKEALPGSHVTMTAEASDNVGVQSVALDVNGTDAVEIPAAPYQRVVNVPDFAAPGTVLKIGAAARDAAGNTGTASATLTVVSEPDTEKPVVSVKAPLRAAPGTVLQVVATASDNAAIASVALTANSIVIGSLTLPPYEATYVIPPGAAIGSTVVVSAQAVDTSNNRATASASIEVVQAPDTTPPSLVLNAPAAAASGTSVPVSANVSDAGGVASVRFFVDGTRIATLVDAPYQMMLPVAPGLPSGARIHVEAHALDFAGLETIDARDVEVISPGEGVLTGEVYDDGTGLPVAGATASLLGTDSRGVPYSQTATTDTRGRYILHGVEGAAIVQISKAGWSTVSRAVVIKPNTGIELIDARVTTAMAAASIDRLSGGTMTGDRALFLDVWQREVSAAEDPSLGSVALGGANVTLTIAPGALTASTDMTMTPLSRQALPGLLPAGWTPIDAVDIGPHGVPLATAASLSAPSALNIKAGTAVVFVQWDDEAHAWRALATTALAQDRGLLTGSISSTGQYAWLVADSIPAAPPAPVPGGLLTGVPTVLISQSATGLVNPQPKVLFYKPGVRSIVRGTIGSMPSLLSSGTVVHSRITESYQFYSQAEMHLEPVEQDVILYQIPGGATPAIAAGFAVSPSQTFDALTLDKGVISVELRAPEEAVHEVPLVGAGGGIVEGSNGERLELGAGSLPVTTPIELRSIALSELGIQVPSGVEFVSATSLSFASALTVPGTFSIQRPAQASDSDLFMLTRLQELGGQTRLVLVGVGKLVNDRLVSDRALAGTDVTFEGVAVPGRYVFLRATTPLAFTAGTVTAASAPFAGALISNNANAIVSMSQSTGRYISAIGVGAITVSAIDLLKTDSVSVQVTSTAPRQVLPLDLSLVARPPTVTSVSPANGAVNVALGDPIVIHFSSAIDPSTATLQAIQLTSSAGVTVGSLSLTSGNSTATLRPVEALKPNTLYTLTISQSVADPFGRQLPSAFTSTFTSLDTVAPPPPAAGGVSATIPGGDGKTTITATQGTAGSHDTVVVRNITRGTVTPVVLDPNGGFVVIVSAFLTDKLQLIITDPAGNQTVVSVPRFRRNNPDGSASEAVQADGGRIQGPGGIAVDVPSGAFPDGAIVTVKPISEAEFPVQLTAEQKQIFTYSGGLQLDLGGANPRVYLNVSVPMRGGETDNDQWVVGQALQVGGQTVLHAVDTARIIDDRIATSSPPCPGVTGAGTYGFLRSAGPVGVAYGTMVSQNSFGTSATLQGDGSSSNMSTMPYQVFSQSVPGVAAPVCMPVVSAAIGAFPATTAVSIDLADLEAKGHHAKDVREVSVANITRSTAPSIFTVSTGLTAGTNRFVVEGSTNDSYSVKATDTAGVQTIACGPSGPACTTSAAVQVATLTVPASAFKDTTRSIVVRNITQKAVANSGGKPLSPVEVRFTQQCPTPGVTCQTSDRHLLFEGSSSDTYNVDLIDGPSSTAPRTVLQNTTATAYGLGTGSFIVRAFTGAIDPNGVAKVEIFNRTQGTSAVVLDAAANDTSRVIEGGFYFATNAASGDQLEVKITSQNGQSTVVKLPTMQITIKNQSSGAIVSNVATFAPPRDHALHIGVISDSASTDPPHLVTTDDILTGIDPVAGIYLTFTSTFPIDLDTIRRGVSLQDSQGNVVSGGWDFSDPTRARLFPRTRLRMGETYTIILSGVTDVYGNRMPLAKLTFTTFKPTVIGSLSTGADGRLLEPLKDLLARRDALGNSRLFATTDIKQAVGPVGQFDRFIAFNVTDPRVPSELSSPAITREQRPVLLPDVSFTLRKPPTKCTDHVTGTTFTGSLAAVMRGQPAGPTSTVAFFDVTDPVQPCRMGDTTLTADPAKLDDVNRLASAYFAGFGKGIAAAKTTTGAVVYGAVANAGLLALDVGRNIPDWGVSDYPNQDKAAFLRGDYTDVAFFKGHVLAVNRNFGPSGATLEVLTPNLGAVASIDIVDSINRIAVAEGFTLLHVEKPTEVLDLAFLAGAQKIWIVDITQIDLPTLIGDIAMPAATRELSVDVARKQLYASGPRGGSLTGDALYIIDATDPYLHGLVDDETFSGQVFVGQGRRDGWLLDDRIIYEFPYANGVNGTVPDDRGLVYAGGPKGLDVIDVEGQFVKIVDRFSKIHKDLSIGIRAVGTGTLKWTTSDSSVIALHQTTGSKVVIEAKAVGHATVTVTLTGKNTTTTDSVDIEVVPFSILHVEGLPDADKPTKGAVLLLNDDDDNGNHQADYDDAGPAPGENDLLRVSLSPVLPVSVSGELTLDADSNKVRLWRTADKQGQITLPVTFNLTGDVPTEIFVEGVTSSGLSRDISLTAYFQSADGAGVVDALPLTVVKTELTVLDINPCCIGFDKTVTPNWLVVPVGGTKTQVVALVAPADAAPLVTSLLTDNDKIAKAELGAAEPPGNNVASRETAIHGVAEGEATLTLRVGQLSAATLRISVRPERIVKVAFYYLSDGLRHTDRKPSDADQSIAKMNEIWSPQTNITFVRSSASEKTIPSPGTSIFVGDHSCDPTDLRGRELASVLAVRDDPNADMNVFFAWDVDFGSNHNINEEGVTVCDSNNVLIDNITTGGIGATEAHEAGHVMKVDPSDYPPPADQGDLMDKFGSGNRIKKAQSDLAHAYLQSKGK